MDEKGRQGQEERKIGKGKGKSEKS